jgi:predicted nuclease with RNAse H fold
MTDQHPLIPVETEFNQIIDEIFRKIDRGTAPHIRSLKEAAVEVIIRHPHSSEMILWLTHQALERMIEDAADKRGIHYSV